MATTLRYEIPAQRMLNEIKELMQHESFETYGRIGQRIKGSEDSQNCCKVTLPCRYADKNIKLIVYEMD